MIFPYAWLVATTTAKAGPTSTWGKSEYVDAIQFYFQNHDDVGVLNIHNTSPSKNIDDLNLKVQENTLEYVMGGHIHCKGSNVEQKLHAHGFFGPLGINGFGNLVSNATLYHDNQMILSKKGGVVAYDQFSIPLNQIKNGSPALKVDPLAELEKARQAFNGSDLQFYQQDREIILERPISFAAMCGKKNNPNKSSAGFHTKTAKVKIKYKGDPALKVLPKLSAKLGNNAPNGFQAGDQPLKITSMNFQPNLTNYVGKCPGTKNIRVNYMGQGEGEIKIRVNGGGKTIYQSGAIAYNGGQDHHDFEIDVPSVSKFNLNKTFDKDLKVYVVVKDGEENIWPSAYQLKDQTDWSYRCTPQLSPNLIGGNNGGIGGYQGQNQGGNAGPGKIQAQPIDPSPAPKPDKIQAKPQRATIPFIKLDGIPGE